MENRKVLNYRILTVVGIIFLAALSRLLPHPPNFTIIGALALFSGAHLNKKLAFAVAIGAMLLSDLFLGFHSTMLYVYFSFILIILIGTKLKQYKMSNLLAASLSSSLLFYLITNFGVWIATDMYAKNLSGLMNSYFMGLPFLRSTVLGDLFYTFSLFYGYKYSMIAIKKYIKTTF